MKRFDHVCCLCSRRHRHGSKAYDPSGHRCAKNCTRKPVVARPPWVGKGSCCLCGSVTPRGLRKCKNRDVCAKRALSGMRVINHDDAWVRAEYQAAAPARELAAAA